MTKLVKKEEETALVQYTAFEEDAGSGLENVTSEDTLTPYLVMLQKTSPQVDIDSPERVEGATAGMFYNNVTTELYNQDGKGILVVPSFFDKIFVEWVDRDKGGGLKGYHKPDSDEVTQAIERNNNSKIGELRNEAGNLLVESYRFYVVLVDADAGSFFPAILSFSSTQIKAAKGWLSKAKTMSLKKADGTPYTPAIYSRLWRLTSIPQQNEKGSWRGWKIDFERYIDPSNVFERSLYEFAKQFFEFARQGTVKIAEEPRVVSAVSEDKAEF